MGINVEHKKTDANVIRGQHLLELIEHNFGTGRDARTKFAALFDRKPATIWPWCNQEGRQGIPHRLRRRFETLVSRDKLEMPKGRGVDDYVRATPTSRLEKSERTRVRNEDLIALFYSAVRHEDLGRAAIERCMSDPAFVVRVLNPSYWLRWAYHSGGVPTSYQEPFTTALIKSRIAEKLMGYDPSNIENETFFVKVQSLFAEGVHDDTDD